ncbi:hypothetical protein AYO20_04660 [Fonsecaea nubica]|uniref:Uncharacterized protein n=1 Tax=Fonsecaea nubica TaxID=856822 RepID=A0A178D1N9_9EURO|nr:hypothetical protein AYO20_04660 [Fonsecaea nubica]OAL35999.1 hypothetical protein AYO20_04660 [Fonsecaea nubica]
MFTSRITTPIPANPQYEDIFSSALSTLFTDDTQTSHGVPGGHVSYHSPRFGKIDLRIPQHPAAEEGRTLFAHYLWNAGVIMAEGLERASSSGTEGERDQAPPPHQHQQDGGDGEQKSEEWQKRYWDVRGTKVLELGAGTTPAHMRKSGTALPSIVAALSGARSATITDHPSSPALTTGAIEQNVRRNRVERVDPPETADADAEPSPSSSPSHPSTATVTQIPSSTAIDIFGYTWGTATMYMPAQYGKPAEPQPEDFDRIIIADCLWMPSQHVNLVKTILRYLHRQEQQASGPAPPGPPIESCALVVAGFHTGREIVRHFFEVATGDYRLPEEEEEEDARENDTRGEDKDKNDQDGDGEAQVAKEVQGRLRAAEIFEIDVNGLRRPWEPLRPGENKDQAKRWCVVAVLVRR